MELANGRYPGKCKQWALAETKGGDPQVALLFELIGEGFTGTQLTYYGSFKEKALKFTVEAMRNCGWEGSDLSELESPDAGLDKNEVSLVVENEQRMNEDGSPAVYEDGSPVMQPRIRWVNANSGLNVKAPLAPDKAKAFAARMKGAILALDQGKPKAPKSSPPRASGPGIPEDAPF